MVVAELLMVKDLVELLLLGEEIRDERTGELVAKIIDKMANNADATARRLLADASRRTGRAREQKLLLALSHLEGAFTARAAILDNDRRTLRYRRRHPELSLDKIDQLVLIALGIAAVHAALGTDEQSVREWVGRAGDLLENWKRQHRAMLGPVGPPVLLEPTFGTAMASLKLGLRGQLNARYRDMVQQLAALVREQQQAREQQFARQVEIIEGGGEPDAVWTTSA